MLMQMTDPVKISLSVEMEEVIILTGLLGFRIFATIFTASASTTCLQCSSVSDSNLHEKTRQKRLILSHSCFNFGLNLVSGNLRQKHMQK